MFITLTPATFCYGATCALNSEKILRSRARNIAQPHKPATLRRSPALVQQMRPAKKQRVLKGSTSACPCAPSADRFLRFVLRFPKHRRRCYGRSEITKVRVETIFVLCLFDAIKLKALNACSEISVAIGNATVKLKFDHDASLSEVCVAGRALIYKSHKACCAVVLVY